MRRRSDASSTPALPGITGELLRKWIPAVIAMGLAVRDDYATSFAAHFYERIALEKSLPGRSSRCEATIRGSSSRTRRWR